MQIAFFIAYRYFLSKKLPGAINLITWVAVVGIAVGTAALIIVLSVFNGFHSLIRDMYQAFDADIRIEANKGKFITDNVNLYKKIRATEGVAVVSRVVEGRAILKYYDRQRIIRLKGVDAHFTQVSEVKQMLQAGNFAIKPNDSIPFVPLVLGTGVAYYVGADLENYDQPMEIYTVTDKRELMASDPERAMNKIPAIVTGVFSTQKEYDELFALADINIAKQLFEVENQISAYEIKVNDVEKAETIKKSLEQVLGNEYKVATWYQQHETLYRLMDNEKKVGYLVIVLMLALTGANIVGCLLMIVSEKRREIGMLRAFGTTDSMIRWIFVVEGLIIAGLGTAIGLSIGFIFNTLQAEYGILKLADDSQGSSFIVDAFPIEQQSLDYVLTIFTVLSLATLAALYPAQKASRIAIATILKD